MAERWNKTNCNENRAIALYAVLARDWSDFIDMLPDENLNTLTHLYHMLTMKNPKHTKGTIELNELGADLVHNHVRKRFNRDLQPLTRTGA